MDGEGIGDHIGSVISEALQRRPDICLVGLAGLSTGFFGTPK